MTEHDLIPLDQHHRLTAGPALWTETRVPAKVFHAARAAFGTESWEDDQRVYRILQAALMTQAAPSTDFERECSDADRILKALGLDPQQYRTEGGSLKVSAITAVLQERQAEAVATFGADPAAPQADDYAEKVAFYAAFSAAEKATGHKPSHYDVWLMARGLMTADGRTTVQPLPPVEGDILPAVGSKVLIHLASQDAWVEHTVVGCYVWPNHGLAPRVFRVFVRVRDADGYLNARSLEDIRYPETASPAPAGA